MILRDGAEIALTGRIRRRARERAPRVHLALAMLVAGLVGFWWAW